MAEHALALVPCCYVWMYLFCFPAGENSTERPLGMAIPDQFAVPALLELSTVPSQLF